MKRFTTMHEVCSQYNGISPSGRTEWSRKNGKKSSEPQKSTQVEEPQLEQSSKTECVEVPSGRAELSCVEVPSCKPSECKHHHENIKLKEVLHQSLKDGTKMMLESTDIVNKLKEEYEKNHSILLEENDLLRKELEAVKSKLIQANELNTQEINQISNKLEKAEKNIEDSLKKEPKKPDIFTRLSQTTKSRKSTG